MRSPLPSLYKHLLTPVLSAIDCRLVDTLGSCKFITRAAGKPTRRASLARAPPGFEPACGPPLRMGTRTALCSHTSSPGAAALLAQADIPRALPHTPQVLPHIPQVLPHILQVLPHTPQTLIHTPQVLPHTPGYNPASARHSPASSGQCLASPWQSSAPPQTPSQCPPAKNPSITHTPPAPLLTSQHGLTRSWGHRGWRRSVTRVMLS